LCVVSRVFALPHRSLSRARQLAALWVLTGVAPRADARRVATALAHSHACVAAHARTAAPPSGEPSDDDDDDDADAARAAAPPPPPRVLVGFARTVSVRRGGTPRRAAPTQKTCAKKAKPDSRLCSLTRALSLTHALLTWHAARLL
jgi:hypothetical protein